MFFVRSVYRHPAFKEGARQALPLAAGLAAWGLTAGVATVKSGMTAIEALAMTLLVYSGSSQLAALPLIAASAPAWIILATAFCVNLRFVVFSLHLRPYLIHLPRWRRLVNGYLTTDATYAVFTSRFSNPGTTCEERAEQEAYLAGNYLVIWSTWMLPSAVGIGLANLVPSAWDLGFAGVLCLLGILCALVSTQLRVLAALLAGAVAIAGSALPFRLNIIAAIGAAVLISFWLERRPLQRRRGQTT